PSPLQRPSRFLPPRVVAKDENVDRQLAIDAVVFPEQIVIEPPELESPSVDARLRTELAGDVIDALVRPRPHDESDERVPRHGIESVGIVDRAARVVVPARDL